VGYSRAGANRTFSPPIHRVISTEAWMASAVENLRLSFNNLRLNNNLHRIRLRMRRQIDRFNRHPSAKKTVRDHFVQIKRPIADTPKGKLDSLILNRNES